MAEIIQFPLTAETSDTFINGLELLEDRLFLEQVIQLSKVDPDARNVLDYLKHLYWEKLCGK